MSDDANERPREHDEPHDEVEGHRGHLRVGANDEPAQEGDDEVEGHGTPKFGATDEPAQEGDDEVEAHRNIKTAAPDADLLA